MLPRYVFVRLRLLLALLGSPAGDCPHGRGRLSHAWALAARSAGRSRVGLSAGLSLAWSSLSLCVLGQAEARHVWQLGTVIAIYAVIAVCVIMSLFMLWSGDSDNSPLPPACRYSRLGRSGIARHAVLDSLPVIGVAVLLALFGAFVVGRSTAD